MPLPIDYVERVYAGILGKIIGVYLGRPFEGWWYDHIMARLGEVSYFVNEQLNSPLILTDDDISGTFTFLRALPDYNYSRDLTPAQIGQTWLNYVIERKTVLWWGGMGQSTEHTAFLRLKRGIQAPESGSIKLNSKIVAEQIGAQIFIDGWAMVAPGDPERAADLARRAASVSHDGEAVYAAQLLTAMEAQAFVESDHDRLLDTGLACIPRDSIIYRMVQDIREWHSAEKDWRKTREKLAAHYGYDKYGGGCHVVPNHGLIILALLHGNNDFQRSLMIVNTSGWDTDCNSGNLGCLLGIKNGLAGLDTGPDWRGPVADRIFLPTADGGRSITDAVIETYHVVNTGRALAGLAPLAPKQGARFHFELPGSVQGFQSRDKVEGSSITTLENVVGHSRLGERSLAIHYQHLASSRDARIETPTFTPPQDLTMSNYSLLASPTLYPGQTVRALVSADVANSSVVRAHLYLRHYTGKDVLAMLTGPDVPLEAGEERELLWRIPDVGGQPIAAIGLGLSSQLRSSGTVYLDLLSWDGAPDVVLTQPRDGGTVWQRAWVDGADHFHHDGGKFCRMIQDDGRGLVIQGTREWTDYRVSTRIIPHMIEKAGLAARVQGMRRYYALLLCNDHTLRLIKALDGDTVLCSMDLPLELDRSYELALQVEGTHLQAWLDGRLLFATEDHDQPLTGGAVALVCELGRIAWDTVTVQPIPSSTKE